MENRALFSSAIVTLAAVVLYYFVMGSRVGNMRAAMNIKAPAITGHPVFERAFRVHANTGEQLIAFLPALWIATWLFRGPFWLPAAFGAAFLVGRVVYMRTYMADPDRRIAGAFLSMLPILALVILGVVGLVQNWASVF